MIVMESRHARRLVVVVHRGEDVVGSLKKLAEAERVRAAWVRGTGLLEWAALTDWDPSREALRPPRHVEGPLALLACEGNVSMRLGEPYVELRAALSREGDAGLVTLGGQLVVAAALNVELVLDVFEDVRLERDVSEHSELPVWKGEHSRGVLARPIDAARGRASSAGPSSAGPSIAAPSSKRREAPSFEEEEPALPEPSKSPAALDWAAVARASSGDTLSDGDEPHPKKGDWIEHRQFGLCRIDNESVDGGLLIRMPSGTRKVVHLEYLEVLPPRFEGERRIFSVRPRRRG